MPVITYQDLQLSVSYTRSSKCFMSQSFVIMILSSIKSGKVNYRDWRLNTAKSNFCVCVLKYSLNLEKLFDVMPFAFLSCCIINFKSKLSGQICTHMCTHMHMYTHVHACCRLQLYHMLYSL